MRTPHRPRRGVVRAVLAAGAALGVGTVVTLAAFTDQAEITTTFTVGSIDLTVNGAQGTPTAYTFTDWTASLMEPGDAVYATLTVANAGTLPLTYTVTAPTFADDDSAALQTALVAGVRIAPTCDEPGYETPTSTVVADGPISALAVTAPRTLAANGGSETLCFKAELPADISGTGGGKVTPTIGFQAAQQTT